MSSNSEQSLAVIIPCFNRREITLACIRKLNSCSYPKISIFVCDSASSDGTQQAVVKEPNVRLLHAGASAWWSEAVNLGVKTAMQEDFELMLLMNDDIEFDLDLITRMVDKHREYPTHILSPAQQSPTGAFLGIDYKGPTRRMQLASNDGMQDTVVDTTNGCCLLIPAGAFRSAGLLDQKHCPHQYGDTEFQIRAAKAGFSTLACPSIEIRQLGATHYFQRLKLGSLFTFKGSPLHLSAYSHFGKTLFAGWIPFLLFGFRFHFLYLKTLVKVLIFLARPQQPTPST
jgi:GT2 family glycosyltransferase